MYELHNCYTFQLFNFCHYLLLAQICIKLFTKNVKLFSFNQNTVLIDFVFIEYKI